jgi:hypothetical protein
MASGKNAHVQHLIEIGALKVFLDALDSSDAVILPIAIWCVSNICAGPACHIRHIIDDGILKKLTSIADTHAEFPTVQREVAYCFTNLTSHSSLYQTKLLVSEFSLLEYLVRFLDENKEDPKMACLIMKSLGNILSDGDVLKEQEEAGQNIFLQCLESIDIVKMLYALESRPEPISTAAYTLIQKYFDRVEQI